MGNALWAMVWTLGNPTTTTHDKQQQILQPQKQE
jgi:hypothetical protein